MTLTLVWLAIGTALWPSLDPVRARLLGLVHEHRLAPETAPGRLAAVAGASWVRHPPALRWWVLVGVVAGSAVGGVGGPGVGVAVVAALSTAGGLVGSAGRRRAAQTAHVALGRALRMLCAELAAGSLPNRALSAAAVVGGPYEPSFRTAAQAAGEGGDVAAALLCGPAALRPLALCWRAGTASGAALAEVLERVGSDVAQRQQQRHDLDAALAGARSSAVLLALLPGLGLVLGTAMGARPLSVLVGSGAGQGLLVAGVILDGLGLIWTGFLVNRALR